MKKYSSIWLILVIISNLYSQSGIEIPVDPFNDEMVKHTAYTLGYSEQHEQARWVAYELTRSEVNGSLKRKDNFRSDPSVSSGSATLSDYRGSGYDRGHLAPAADMKMNGTYMSESFYMSNMSPQEPGFNRGIWKKLEGVVRGMAVRNQAVYVVTGPIFVSNKGAIGRNQVTVPGYYYKVILDYREPDIKAIGFILPNAKSSQPLSTYAKTVDEVESRTGLDFFAKLPDKIENSLEGSINIRAWSLKGAPSSGRSSSHSPSVTKTKMSSSSGRCQAITKKGTQCKRKAQSGSIYCWQHQK